MVFEGWWAAGKGGASGAGRAPGPSRAPPYSIIPPPRRETQYPWMWRFWLKIPAYGQMVVFDESWYRRVLIERRIERQIPKREAEEAYQDIVEFERTLADGRDRHRQVLAPHRPRRAGEAVRALWADTLTAWQVSDEDRSSIVSYKRTERGRGDAGAQRHLGAPWVIVEATDRRLARLKMMETLAGTVEQRLGDLAGATPDRGRGRASTNTGGGVRCSLTPTSPGAHQGGVRAPPQAPPEPAARARLPRVPGEAAGRDRVRGARRVGQGRRHQAAHLRASTRAGTWWRRSPRLPGRTRSTTTCTGSGAGSRSRDRSRCSTGRGTGGCSSSAWRGSRPRRRGRVPTGRSTSSNGGSSSSARSSSSSGCGSQGGAASSVPGARARPLQVLEAHRRGLAQPREVGGLRARPRTTCSSRPAPRTPRGRWSRPTTSRSRAIKVMRTVEAVLQRELT